MSESAERSGTEGGRSRRARADWLRAEAALYLLAAFCPLALGTVHAATLAVAAGLGTLAFALAAFASYRSGERFELAPPSLAFTAVAAFIALQLVPLPPALLKLVSPHADDLYAFALGPLGRYPAWRPLSLDPSGTARALATALVALAAFLSASQIARSRRARRRIIVMLGATGLAVAAVGYLHELAGAERLFGAYAFSIRPPFLSTFGNPNHLASLLTVGASALLCVVLTERDRRVATLWGFGYLATAVALVLSLSCGGILAFGASQLLLVFAWRRTKTAEGASRGALLVIPAALACVAAVAGWLAWDALAGEIASADSVEKLRESKIALWPYFKALVLDYPFTGVGRGAFESAFQRYQPAGDVTFVFPESLPFQWATELGLPVALLLGAACVLTCARVLQKRDASLETLACLCAVIGVGLHDVVDFGLEFPGVAVPAAVAFAVATSGLERGRIPRRAALALSPALGAAFAVAFFLSRPSLRDDGEALAQAMTSAPAPQLIERAHEAAGRHPADFYPHLIEAQLLARTKPLNPSALFASASRAMYLNPAHPSPHRFAAEALLSTGHRAQAALEYRLAWRYGDSALTEEVVRVSRSVDEMLAATPEAEAPVLALMWALERRGRSEEAQAAAERTLAVIGDHLQLLQRLAVLVDQKRDARRLADLAARMEKVAPDQPDGILTRARSMELAGDRAGAITLLSGEGLTRYARFPRMVFALCELQMRVPDARGCRESLKRLPPGLDRDVLLSKQFWESALYESDGQFGKAAAAMKESVQLAPESAPARLRYALMLEKAGRFEQAKSEAERLLTSELKREAQALIERVSAKKKELDAARQWKAAEGADGP